MKFLPLSALLAVAIAVVSPVHAAASKAKCTKCAAKKCEPITGQPREAFDQRGLLVPSGYANGPVKYGLVIHGKCAPLVVPSDHEAAVAPFSGSKRVMHIVGKWGPVTNGPFAKLFGKGSDFVGNAVYVTDAHVSVESKSSKHHKAAKSDEEAKPEAKADEAKPAEAKPAEAAKPEEKPAEKQ
jgi:hypothetical protein